MGITIYYAGEIRDVNLVSKLIGELKDFSKAAGWEYKIIDCRPNIFGIALDIHPKCETFLLTFGEDGVLKHFYEHKDKGGKIKTTEARSLSVKTQYAGVKVHIIIIKILKYLKKKYIPDLDVEDEGDFWEKQDLEILRKNFASVQAAIDGLGNALEDYSAGRKVDPLYDRVIQAIEQLGDDEIWAEEQWEEFFEKNEKLMDKYEQVHSEDPDREWKHPYDLYCKVHYGIDFGKDFSFAGLKDDENEHEAKDESELISESYSLPLIDEHELERKTHPILEESFQFSLSVMDFAKGLDGKKDIQKTLSNFVSAALQISAKLHGAHGIGYERDVLEGNIATCKIALKNACLAIGALNELKPEVGSLILFAKIEEKLRQLKVNVEEWIAELRGRVWWR